MEAMSKALTRPTEEEIRAMCAELDADERKVIEGFLCILKGDEAAGKALFAECLNSRSPGVSFFAEMQLKPVNESAPKEPKLFTADRDLDKVIGWVRWSVTEAPSFDVIAEGEKFIQLGDVSVQSIEADGEPLLSRSFTLNEDFSFGLSGARKRSGDVIGFAFTAKNRVAESFSWEWFSVDSPGYAIKIQEIGELEFGTTESSDGADISHTRFTKPLSLRVSRMGVDSPLEPHWRVVIAENSEITWPSLIGDKVVPNDRPT
jgi:hypothetical protein